MPRSAALSRFPSRRQAWGRGLWRLPSAGPKGSPWRDNIRSRGGPRRASALDRLRTYVSTAPDVSTDGGLALSYALYVLARNGMAPVGDVRYIADVKLSALATPTAKAEIGAALAMLGDRVRAEKAFDAALGALPEDPKFEGGRTDYGSPPPARAVAVTPAAAGAAPPRM